MKPDMLKSEKKVKQTFEKFLHTYFTERDHAALIAMLHPSICAIGTGADEVADSYEKLTALFARDIAQCPSPINYKIISSHVIFSADSSAIIMAVISLNGTINQLPFTIPNVRATFIITKSNGQWLFQHIHFSQEQSNLDTGEAFPVHELEEKNKILQQLVAERTRDLSKALAEIELTASTDKLTGVYNRRKFDDLLDYEIRQANRLHKPLSLAIADIDHFKIINDTYGHLMGDKMLKIISRLMQKSIKSTDILARWGGEEFVFLFPDTEMTNTMLVIERLRETIFSHENAYNINMSVSFGVAEYILEENIDSFLKRADQALYAAKTLGRNRVALAGRDAPIKRPIE